ncbi:hypothetical protein N798_15675 [Knoellia flava TL1]|uniref:DUF4232 domain-containing protein n=2 Tax=Knoellia flava TaxID=913969 RepID=A0A8H9FQJ7_9MICO|nr:hypothetical protein [Knoellia flava]KGN29051.1 hypothetical protein N798_15675 [Knoellia flava TL1]GGB69968.1 hypothetical protein GCM10011314_06600 [Knoellia flava]
MTEQREERRISRRTIAKGAAWTVPAVPLVMATPAYAASGGGPTGNFLGACKQPGNSCEPYGFNKGYSFLVSVTNTSTKPIYVYTRATGDLTPIFSIVTSSQSGVTFAYGDAVQYEPQVGEPPVYTPLPTSILIQPGQTVQLIIDASSSNSANFTASGNLYLAWGHTSTPGSDPDHPYVPKPPATNFGEGWIRIPFSTTFPPCDKDRYCVP